MGQLGNRDDTLLLQFAANIADALLSYQDVTLLWAALYTGNGVKPTVAFPCVEPLHRGISHDSFHLTHIQHMVTDSQHILQTAGNPQAAAVHHFLRKALLSG